ncbi:hypothetical protein FSPOR_409, partial [Fusarium sporotrichioides]
MSRVFFLPGQTINVPEMLAKTTRSGSDIVMGDLNLHHPSWSGQLFRGDHSKVLLPARLLEEGMANADMVLKTTPGTATFVAGRSLQNHVQSCRVYEQSPWPESDHRPIRTTLEIQLFRDTRIRCLFDKTNVKLFNAKVASNLQPLDELEAIELNQEGSEKLANDIIESLKKAIDEIVPTDEVYPPPKKPLDHKTRQFLDGDGTTFSQSTP